MAGNILFDGRTLFRKHTAVLLGREMPGTRFGNAPPPRHSPLRIDLGKEVGMELFHPLAELVLVLSREYLLVRKAVVLDRQQRAVYVRVHFVEMYDEGGDVLLAVSAADERIDILRPTFDVAFPLDTGIGCPLVEIYLLRAERQFAHAVSGTAEDDVDHRAVFRLIQTLVRVPDPAPVQNFGHPFGDAAALVHGTDFAALDDFEVQVFAAGVVIALFERLFPSLLRPTALMFVALRCRDAFRYPDIEYCLLLPYFFALIRTNPPCPSLLLVRTPLPPASAGRGIELPHPFVWWPGGQARVPLQPRECLAGTGADCRGYTNSVSGLRVNPPPPVRVPQAPERTCGTI